MKIIRLLFKKKLTRNPVSCPERIDPNPKLFIRFLWWSMWTILLQLFEFFRPEQCTFNLGSTFFLGGHLEKHVTWRHGSQLCNISLITFMALYDT